MPIAADPFAPPRAIGQGLTPIAQPNYAPSSGGGPSTEGEQSAAQGPFGSGGSLSTGADQAREGLSSLLTKAGAGNDPSLASSSGALPISEIGMPTLGGSPVSTGGGAATNQRSSLSGGGLASLIGAGEGASGGGGGGPAQGSANPSGQLSMAAFEGVPSSITNTVTAGKLGMMGLGLAGINSLGPALSIASPLMGAFGLPLAVAGLGNQASNLVGNNAVLNQFNAALNTMSAEEANAAINAMQAKVEGISSTISRGGLAFESDPIAIAVAGRNGLQGVPFEGGMLFGGTLSVGGPQGPIGLGFQGPQGASFGLGPSAPGAGPTFGGQTLTEGTIAQALASLFGGGRGNAPDLETSEGGQASMGGPPGGPAGSPGTAGPSAGTATGDSSTGGDPGGSTYARGGLVPDLHPGGGDDEPAMLTGGEFVFKPGAVKRLGLARLMRENRAG